MKPTAWLKELVPEKGMEWQVKMTTVEEVAKDWEAPVIPLYTKAKEDWSGLTYEEQEEVVSSAHSIRDAILKAETKLKEKNKCETH
jgi:hypothetical protein